MKEKHMRFGRYIRSKRLANPRELRQLDVANHLGISLTYYSQIEVGTKKPLEGGKLERLAKFLELTDEETALMYDLAGRETREVPYDIEDTLMHEDVGDLIRYATRRSRDGFIKEEDWKTFIRQMEAEKRNGRGDEDD
jgi:transcriptional regulator with XRE-family HTH domain